MRRRRRSRSGSTNRQKFKEHRHQSSREVKPAESDSGATKIGGNVQIHLSQNRKCEKRSVVPTVEVKPRKRIGLISQDCPGFQYPHARLWCTIDKRELTKILIDIRREVEQPRPRAKVERGLGDPSLFVVPSDLRQPLASRVEFKGSSKPWQEVNVAGVSKMPYFSRNLLIIKLIF